jgi:hypothetical protein
MKNMVDVIIIFLIFMNKVLKLKKVKTIFHFFKSNILLYLDINQAVYWLKLNCNDINLIISHPSYILFP